jgi:hypothetical protein
MPGSFYQKKFDILLKDLSAINIERWVSDYIANWDTFKRSYLQECHL